MHYGVAFVCVYPQIIIGDNGVFSSSRLWEQEADIQSPGFPYRQASPLAWSISFLDLALPPGLPSRPMRMWTKWRSQAPLR